MYLSRAVMFLLTWPYIEHHNLRVKFVALAQAHYPGMLEKIKAMYNFLKTLGKAYPVKTILHVCWGEH